VSDSHEPSYYEIALTNRQVIVAFVILLVCLIAAFFSGVWVGRENGYRAAEQMARNTPPVEEEEKEGRNLEELEFFESEQKTAAPQTPPAPSEPAAPGESSTLAEDVGAEEAASPEETAPDQPEGEEGDRKARREKRRQREEEERKEKERKAAERKAQERQVEPARREPAPAPAPKTTAPAPAEPARSAGQVVIQVFSSPEKDQAERIRSQLVRGGQRAFLSPVEVAGRTMYRVRIGPFDSRGDAQKVAEQVRKGYKLDTWVTE
jgi:cell division protein FtsN